MSKLSGLTRVDCAIGCSEKGGLIGAGQPHCMHPCKGGVPPNFKNDPAVQVNYAQACELLGVANKHLVMQ
jgi:hypothetical protein